MIRDNVMFSLMTKNKQKKINEQNGIVVEGTEDCGECKEVFYSTHKKLTIVPTTIGFIALLCLIAAIYGNKYL